MGTMKRSCLATLVVITLAPLQSPIPVAQAYYGCGYRLTVELVVNNARPSLTTPTKLRERRT